VILSHVGFNAVIADRGDDAATIISEEVADNIKEYVGSLAANVVGAAGARVTEGTINAMLIRRLGRQLKNHIRPIQA
jgi:hypothetical protein